MTVDPNISLYTLRSRTLGSQLLENTERRCYIKVTGEEGSMLFELALDQTN